MVQVSGTNARFLAPPVVLSEVMRVMAPNLIWLDKIPFIDTGGLPVVYGKRANASSDPKKQTPRIITPAGGFPEVQISRMTKETALTVAEGLTIKFDESALTLPSGKDMISDSLNKVAYWVAEYMNTSIYTALLAGATDSGTTVSGQWSVEATATPDQDLKAIGNSMIREGYPYRTTDFFLESVNFNELESFLMASQRIVDYNAVMSRPNLDEIRLPGGGIAHRMLSSVTHGDVLAMDSINKSAAAVYYNNNSMFGTPMSISYETVVDGKPTMKTVPNFGLNTHQFFNDKEHVQEVQVWIETVTKVKDAYGLIKENGI